jgi:hypothetical protein
MQKHNFLRGVFCISLPKKCSLLQNSAISLRKNFEMENIFYVAIAKFVDTTIVENGETENREKSRWEVNNNKTMNAIVNVTFKGGRGHLDVKVLRGGANVPQAGSTSTDNTGIINLSDVQSGDTISIDGDSPANGTDVSIDVKTGPPTPDHYYEGLISAGYIVL